MILILKNSKKLLNASVIITYKYITIRLTFR